MKKRELLYFWIAGGALIGIVIGMCISLLYESNVLEQTYQTTTHAPKWWVMDPNEWWDNTPEGQDVSGRLISGELSVDDMKFIVDEMGEGHSYEDARRRIGHGMARLRRYSDAPVKH